MNIVENLCYSAQFPCVSSILYTSSINYIEVSENLETYACQHEMFTSKNGTVPETSLKIYTTQVQPNK
jgi:hypothetical protein